MDGIKKWLVACGASFGVKEVHPYRWPDTSTKPEVPYLTYTPIQMKPIGAPLRNVPEIQGHDVTTNTVQKVGVFLRIDLFNSEFGLAHLAWCALAAEKEQAIKDVFSRYNMAFVEIDGEIGELTTFDAEKLYYHQSMVVVIRTWLNYAHLNRNHKVDTVKISDAVSVDTVKISDAVSLE